MRPRRTVGSGSTAIGCGITTPQMELDALVPGQGRNRTSDRLHHRWSFISRQHFHFAKSLTEKSLLLFTFWNVIERSASTFHSRTLFVTRFLHPCVGVQPASGLATGPSINQGANFIASYNSVPFECLTTSFRRPSSDQFLCRRDVHLSSLTVPPKYPDPTMIPD